MTSRRRARGATLGAGVLVAGLLGALAGCGSQLSQVSDASEGPTTAIAVPTGPGTSPRRPLPLGTARASEGTTSASSFEVTPRTESRDDVQGYWFVTVVVDVRNTGSTAGLPSHGQRGSGWALVEPDGAVSAQDDVAARLVVPGFAPTSLAPGASGQLAVSLTLPAADRTRALVLEHLDGRGRTSYWSLPAADTGPDLAAWHAALAPFQRL